MNSSALPQDNASYVVASTGAFGAPQAAQNGDAGSGVMQQPYGGGSGLGDPPAASAAGPYAQSFPQTASYGHGADVAFFEGGDLGVGQGLQAPSYDQAPQQSHSGEGAYTSQPSTAPIQAPNYHQDASPYAPQGVPQGGGFGYDAAPAGDWPAGDVGANSYVQNSQQQSTAPSAYYGQQAAVAESAYVSQSAPEPQAGYGQQNDAGSYGAAPMGGSEGYTLPSQPELAQAPDVNYYSTAGYGAGAGGITAQASVAPMPVPAQPNLFVPTQYGNNQWGGGGAQTAPMYTQQFTPPAHGGNLMVSSSVSYPAHGNPSTSCRVAGFGFGGRLAYYCTETRQIHLGTLTSLGIPPPPSPTHMAQDGQQHHQTTFAREAALVKLFPGPLVCGDATSPHKTKEAIKKYLDAVYVAKSEAQEKGHPPAQGMGMGVGGGVGGGVGQGSTNLEDERRLHGVLKWMIAVKFDKLAGPKAAEALARVLLEASPQEAAPSNVSSPWDAPGAGLGGGLGGGIGGGGVGGGATKAAPSGRAFRSSPIHPPRH